MVLDYTVSRSWLPLTLRATYILSNSFYSCCFNHFDVIIILQEEDRAAFVHLFTHL